MSRQNRCRELLALEMAMKAGDCPLSMGVVTSVTAGRLDDTVEMMALVEAAAIGEAKPVALDAVIGRARQVLACAFDRADRARGGSLLTSGCARVIRAGQWDELPILRAIGRALAGDAVEDAAGLLDRRRS